MFWALVPWLVVSFWDAVELLRRWSLSERSRLLGADLWRSGTSDAGSLLPGCLMSPPHTPTAWPCFPHYDGQQPCDTMNLSSLQMTPSRILAQLSKKYLTEYGNHTTLKKKAHRYKIWDVHTRTGRDLRVPPGHERCEISITENVWKTLCKPDQNFFFKTSPNFQYANSLLLLVVLFHHSNRNVTNILTQPHLQERLRETKKNHNHKQCIRELLPTGNGLENSYLQHSSRSVRD